MAEGGNEQFVPEDEDFELFAEYVVNYVMILNEPLYIFAIDETRYRDYTQNPFHQIIERAAGMLDDSFEIVSYDTFREIHEIGDVTSTTYTTFVDSLFAHYFDEGFDARNFLSFCVRISKMAELYYLHGIVDAPMLAESYIVNILKDHNTTFDIWNNLHRIAREINNEVRENDRLLENIESGEIEMNLAQDDASGHESRNIVAGHEENVVQRQDRACSEKEINLMKSAQYCSESSSERSSSPLKEPETSSEYSPPTSKLEGNKSFNRSATGENLSIGRSNIDKKIVDTESISKSLREMSFDEFTDGVDKSISEVSGSSKSDVPVKRDCKRKFDLTLNVEDDESSEVLSSEEKELIDNLPPKDGFHTETSKRANQESSFTSKKRSKVMDELTSDEKSDVNYPSTSSDGNNLVNKSESNEKLFSETPNATDMSVSRKRKLDLTSNTEDSSSAENVSLTDEEVSPKLKDRVKHLKIERLSPPSSDEEGIS